MEMYDGRGLLAGQRQGKPIDMFSKKKYKPYTVVVMMHKLLVKCHFPNVNCYALLTITFIENNYYLHKDKQVRLPGIDGCIPG